jgi:hypothetical protein
MRLYFFLLEKELTEADDETQGASTYTCPNRAAALTAAAGTQAVVLVPCLDWRPGTWCRHRYSPISRLNRSRPDKKGRTYG